MSIDKEIWLLVPSEPGLLVSSHGRVLLPPRYAPLSSGGYRFYETKPRIGQISKAAKNASHEFRIVMLWDNQQGRRQRPRAVHRLVCEAFHGPAPFPDAVVMHLDEDGKNNRPDNLKWGTQRENMNAPGLKSYHRSRVGENSARAIGRAKNMEISA